MGLKTGKAGINLIKQFEGCRLQAYKCPAGVQTIGYGHTGGVKPGQAISQAQADAILLVDLEKFEKNVNKYQEKYKFSQSEFDALVSFAFNLGSIDKLTAGGTRNRKEIAEKMLQYNKAGGKELPGLTRRRKAERDLFLSGTTQASRPTLRKGSKGEPVRELQTALRAAGYNIAADGIFGAKTLEAVKAYQADHGLAVDGIAGPATWGQLTGK